MKEGGKTGQSDAIQEFYPILTAVKMNEEGHEPINVVF